MRLAVRLGIYIYDGSQIKQSKLIRYVSWQPKPVCKGSREGEVIVSDKRSELI